LGFTGRARDARGRDGVRAVVTTGDVGDGVATRRVPGDQPAMASIFRVWDRGRRGTGAEHEAEEGAV